MKVKINQGLWKTGNKGTVIEEIKGKGKMDIWKTENEGTEIKEIEGERKNG